MFYIVYKTTNMHNGKIYIGSHKAEVLEDGYLGSGTILKHALKKHGTTNFRRENLFVFNSAEQMFEKEAELVTEEFVKRSDTYNMKIGGFGGWDHIDNRGRIFSDESRKKMSETKSKIFVGEGNPFYGKEHTTETIESIRKKSLEIAKSRYENSVAGGTHINSSVGSCPHCGKQGQLRAMKRWHFENCKTIQSSHHQKDSQDQYRCEIVHSNK